MAGTGGTSMKKAVLLFLIAAILSGLCACGAKDKPAETTTIPEPGNVQTPEPEETPTPEPEVSTEDLLCAEDWVSHDSPWRMTWKPDGSGAIVHKYSGKQMTVFDWTIQENGTISLVTPSDTINDFTYRLTDENGIKTLTAIENDVVFVQVSNYQKSEYDLAYERLTFSEQSFIRRNALLLQLHFADDFDAEQLTVYSVVENERGTQVAVSDGGAIHRLSIEMGATAGTIYYKGDYASADEITDRGVFDLDAVNRALRLYFTEPSAMSIAE